MPTQVGETCRWPSGQPLLQFFFKHCTTAGTGLSELVQIGEVILVWWHHFRPTVVAAGLPTGMCNLCDRITAS
jgi:hypothetical protein